MLLLVNLKKEIRRGAELLWKTTNNIQSRRTERMQFICLLKQKNRLLFKTCQKVCLSSA